MYGVVFLRNKILHLQLKTKLLKTLIFLDVGGAKRRRLLRTRLGK